MSHNNISGNSGPNHLINETSPYLLQHAYNPVEWYPWGEEALSRARDEDKPILLSIGYSSCHWCHVMAHESFENPNIAAQMNRKYVNIKVDREERPDLDSIYMDAVQALTGQGGWPMTVFLTPDGRPFYGGTYFPPTDRMGMPGFPKVLDAIADAYRNQREEIERGSNEIQEQLRRYSEARIPASTVSQQTIEGALAKLSSAFEPQFGGFGRAPKFPQAPVLEFLLQVYARTGNGDALSMLTRTLDGMATGGMYDHLGGGFARYSVDNRWLVPHFEKMLYDNTQLASVYTKAWLATHNDRYREVAEATLDYLLRDMASPEGGFYSSEDADSEGEEGKFYVWTPSEIESVLGADDARVVCAYYGVTDRGNFEGKNILNRLTPMDAVSQQTGRSDAEIKAVVERSRPQLLAARNERMRPGRDDKILACWNGLALSALATAGAAFGREDYLNAAAWNAEFITGKLLSSDSLARSYKDGRAIVSGFLEDYGAVANGLIALYQSTFDVRWLHKAKELANSMLDRFWDEELQGFYDTEHGGEALYTRPRNLYDQAVPSGTSLASTTLQQLSGYFYDSRYEDVVRTIVESLGAAAAEQPQAMGLLLCTTYTHISTLTEIAIVGDEQDNSTQAMIRTLRERYIPGSVLAYSKPDSGEKVSAIPLLAEKTALSGRGTAYVCRNHVCDAPVMDPDALGAQLFGPAPRDTLQ